MEKIDQINSVFIDFGWSASKELEFFDDSSLSEDLAQYSKDNITLDFGFFGDESKPEFGEYVIYIIENSDWENYLAKLIYKKPSVALSALENLASNYSIFISK